MDNTLDSIIKNVLKDETKNISQSEDAFGKIKEELESGKVKKKRGKYTVLAFGIKKSASVFACFLAVCITLLFAASNQARALASQAIESITTIFVLETNGDDVQIVEKPSNEALMTNSICRTTFKSDEELEKILGFRVCFPTSLDTSSGGSFALNDKNLGVVLKEQLDYEKLQSLVNEMLSATEDDNSLMRLAPYKPSRDIYGTYKRKDGSTIFINATKSWNISEIGTQYKDEKDEQNKNLQKIKVNEMDGYWEKILCPVYPVIIEDGIGKSDMTIKPEIKEIHTLTWGNSEMVFILNTYQDFELTLEESLEIAEEFMKSNNK